MNRPAVCGVCLLLAVLSITACGGEGGGNTPDATAGAGVQQPDTGMADDDSQPPPQDPPATDDPEPADDDPPEDAPPAVEPPAPLPVPTLALNDLQLAQTHVIPPAGLSWAQDGGAEITLTLVGARSALAMLDVAPDDVDGVQLEGRIGTTMLGAVDVAGTDALPASESDGPRYSDTLRPAQIPAEWVRPGLELRLNAALADPSAWQAVTVGASAEFVIQSLPFYLFGTDDEDVPLAQASRPAAAAIDELFAKWPVSGIEVPNHPAIRVDWPQLVIAPRNGNPAYVMNSADDAQSGFDPISAVRNAAVELRGAAGEAGTANQYYSALVMANADGSFRSAGGGLGGGHVGAGDHRFAGIFVHEQGHAFGLPHAGESFDADSGYPYPGGSLSGSAWSFDQLRQIFQPVIVPSNASRFANCSNNSFGGTPRQMDAQNRCIRQDPMQSGSGDQAAGDAYSTFADYHAGRMQQYFQGVTTDNGDGSRSYSGGRIFESGQSSTGYRRWDTVDQGFVEYDPSVERSKGLYGVNNGYPIATNTPVYSVVFTLTNAGTAGVTQIYPVIGPYDGNLLRTFDPTSADDRALVLPNTSTYPWYCRLTGCDTTIRATYADGSVRHVGIHEGFRQFFTNGEAPPAVASEPTSSQSFLQLAVNLPADAALVRVELLDTPKWYDGLPAAPAVLAARLVGE